MMDDELKRIIERAQKASESPEAQKRQVEAAEYDARQQSHNLLKALEAVGVPRKSREAALGELKLTSALGQVQSWSQTTRNLLILSGGVGVGKSVAAAWWMAQMVVDMKPTPRTPRHWWRAMLVARRGVYSDEHEMLYSVRGLVIDDVGTEYSDVRGFFGSTLEDVVDHRYENGLPTLLTTNMRPADFCERYGERIHDRLCECGAWIALVGRSLRKQSSGEEPERRVVDGDAEPKERQEDGHRESDKEYPEKAPGRSLKRRNGVDAGAGAYFE